MYERFYNLRERPFALSPDPDYLYPSRVHREALSYLRYGIEGHAGFVVVTGDVGCGKTTLLQTMLRQLDRQTAVSRLVNTTLDARELIEAVMLDFGLDPGQGRSKPHLLRDLARFLVDQRTAGRLALLVIDEAQNLGLTALEEVRMLSNLETEKSKLIQIILVGQPGLRDILARPDLEQLRQRVTVSYHLKPLEIDETAAYLNHRLRRAAIGAPLEWPRDVTDVVHLHAEGIPRKINVIADAILLFGYGEERRVVDVRLAREAVDELVATGVIAARVESTAPSPVIAPAPVPSAADLNAATALDHELRLREARLDERERRIAEQQRILLEGYQLLRNVRGNPTATAPPTAAASPAWPPSRPAPRTQAAARVETPPTPAPSVDQLAVSAPTRFTASAPSETFWGRLRRGLFGTGRPVIENLRY